MIVNLAFKCILQLIIYHSSSPLFNKSVYNYKVYNFDIKKQDDFSKSIQNHPTFSEFHNPVINSISFVSPFPGFYDRYSLYTDPLISISSVDNLLDLLILDAHNIPVHCRLLFLGYLIGSSRPGRISNKD